MRLEWRSCWRRSSWGEVSSLLQAKLNKNSANSDDMSVCVCIDPQLVRGNE